MTAPALTPETLRRLQEAATPGPWQGHHGEDVTGYPVYSLHGFSGDQKRDDALHEANLELIVALRNAVPQLLAALDDQARLAKLREMLNAKAEAIRMADVPPLHSLTVKQSAEMALITDVLALLTDAPRRDEAQP